VSNSKAIVRDGVVIPLPEPAEQRAFNVWLKANKVRDPMHPDQHYDYVSAFRAGEGRAAGPDGHFTDRFKLPYHPRFSDESQYATGENLRNAGHWQGDNYVVSPAELGRTVLDIFRQQALLRELQPRKL
jgi:hypothetical protein